MNDRMGHGGRIVMKGRKELSFIDLVSFDRTLFHGMNLK